MQCLVLHVARNKNMTLLKCNIAILYMPFSNKKKCVGGGGGVFAKRGNEDYEPVVKKTWGGGGISCDIKPSKKYLSQNYNNKKIQSFVFLSTL